MAGKFGGKLDAKTGEIYHRSKIALLTGWRLDYIDSLGLVDQEGILQVFEAEQAILSSIKRKKKWR